MFCGVTIGWNENGQSDDDVISVFILRAIDDRGELKLEVSVHKTGRWL